MNILLKAFDVPIFMSFPDFLELSHLQAYCIPALTIQKGDSGYAHLSPLGVQPFLIDWDCFLVGSLWR